MRDDWAPLFALLEDFAAKKVLCGQCGRLKHFARGDFRHGWQGCLSGFQGWPQNANRRESR